MNSRIQFCIYITVALMLSMTARAEFNNPGPEDTPIKEGDVLKISNDMLFKAMEPFQMDWKREDIGFASSFSIGSDEREGDIRTECVFVIPRSSVQTWLGLFGGASAELKQNLKQKREVTLPAQSAQVVEWNNPDNNWRYEAKMKMKFKGEIVDVKLNCKNHPYQEWMDYWYTLPVTPNLLRKVFPNGEFSIQVPPSPSRPHQEASSERDPSR